MGAQRSLIQLPSRRAVGKGSQRVCVTCAHHSSDHVVVAPEMEEEFSECEALKARLRHQGPALSDVRLCCVVGFVFANDLSEWNRWWVPATLVRGLARSSC